MQTIDDVITPKNVEVDYNSIINEEIDAADLVLKRGRINFHSFEPKDVLNPDVFDESDHMLAGFHNGVLDVIKRLYDDIPQIDDLDISDIVIVGSLVSYHYSSYSDIDLHFIVNFADDDQKSEFDKYRKDWNDNNNIKIHGYDVEIYFQPKDDENITNGIYSVCRDEWVKHPDKEYYTIDKKGIERKVLRYIMMIDRLDREEYPNKNEIERLDEKIVKGRSAALKEDGEFCNENIIFKILRRTGHIGKLKKMQKQHCNKN